MNSRTRRCLGLSVTAVRLGSSGQILGAAPAAAHGSRVSGTSSCGPDGQYAVTWRINDGPTHRGAAARVATLSPRSASISPSHVVLSNGSGVLTERAAGSSTFAAVVLLVSGRHRDRLTWGWVGLGGSCSPSVVAPAPTAMNGACSASRGLAPHVTIPSRDGITYRLDGLDVAAGSVSVSPGVHTVEARSEQLRLSGRTTFHLNVRGGGECRSLSAPARVRAVPTACGRDAALYLPHTAGVFYSARRGPYPAGDSVLVTARAGSGHVLSAAPGWSRSGSSLATTTVTFGRASTCSAEQGRTGLSAVRTPAQKAGSPSGHATHSAVRASVAVGPDTTATRHRSNPVASAGSVRAGSVRGSSRHVLMNAAVSRSRSHSTSGVGAIALFGRVTGRPIVAAPAAFADTTCVSGRATGSSYTTQFVSGVRYHVGGKNLSTGTYPARDGTTLTVVAAAAPGRMLSGITQWTHTFRKAPSGCAAANPAHAGPVSTRPTAHTGPASIQLIVLGSLLLLTGTVCLIAASARRPGTVRP